MRSASTIAAIDSTMTGTLCAKQMSWRPFILRVPILSAEKSHVCCAFAMLDVGFTAKMEKGLDKVEAGKNDWVTMIKKFYEDFSKALETAQKNQGTEKIRVPEEETDVICEKCGSKMVIKSGRYGKFIQ